MADTAFVTDFMQKNGASIHEVFTIETKFNESTSRYEAKDKHREFLEALAHYRELEGNRLHFNPSKCSWEDVISELNKAHDAVSMTEQREKTLGGKTRKFVKKSITILQPAVDAIPDELFVLQGGLAIIFDLVQRHDKSREQILDVFGEIPQILSMACNRLIEFPDNEKLGHLLDELKISLFDTIPNLVNILLPKTFRSKFTSPFKDTYPLLQYLRVKARRLEAHAKILQDSLVVKISHDTAFLKDTSSAVKIRVDAVHESLSAVGRDVRSINTHYELHERRMDLQLKQLKESWDRQITHALNSQTNMFQMLQDVVAGFKLNEQDTTSQTSSPGASSSPEYLTRLLQILDVYSEQGDYGIADILRQTQEFDMACKTLLATVLSDARFYDLIMTDGSNLVYLEAQLDPSSFGRTNPVSYICANLVGILKKRPNNISLHFFCGQHIASNDATQGPRGLIRSLLVQTLETWPGVPLSCIDLSGFHESHTTTPMSVLCSAFEQILLLAPTYGTIFCVIDNITQFERDDMVGDYSELLNMLATVVNNEVGPRVKVLVTSPIRSRWLPEIAGNQTIHLTERDW